MHIKDWAQLVRDAKDSLYDVSIQDSLDPWDIEEEHYSYHIPVHLS
jgi:hypothetical protein